MIKTGQVEVFNWLKNKRASGSEDFYTINDIRAGLKSSVNNGCNFDHIGSDVIKLTEFGYLEIKDRFTWNKRYRIKKKYIK